MPQAASGISTVSIPSYPYEASNGKERERKRERRHSRVIFPSFLPSVLLSFLLSPGGGAAGEIPLHTDTARARMTDTAVGTRLVHPQSHIYRNRDSFRGYIKSIQFFQE